LKILERRGSWRASRNKAEPQPPNGSPSCPAWLSDRAKYAWRSMKRLLETMQVLTVADRNALTRYCVLWDRWRQAEEFLQEHGATFDAKDGPKPWPQVRIAANLADQLGRLEQAFGLTPASRSRVTANVNHGAKNKDEDGKAKKRSHLRLSVG
jgi:P27 family predicted phage terminase small subunit